MEDVTLTFIEFTTLYGLATIGFLTTVFSLVKLFKKYVYINMDWFSKINDLYLARALIRGLYGRDTANLILWRIHGKHNIRAKITRS